VRVLDLFSGVGGIALACEWAGMETVAFCEIEPYCQKVLHKHWPGIPTFDDIRTLTKQSLIERGVIDDGEAARASGVVPRGIDLVCGGFP
jgi:DNA (cytosine-5)-methyltransferase 1